MTDEARYVIPQISKVLKDLFPKADLDFESVAKLILDRVEIVALRQIEDREAALQEALSATMNYLGTINKSLHQRIHDLETKNARLTERLCQREVAANVD